MSSCSLSLLFLHICPALSTGNRICLRHYKLSSKSWKENLCGFPDDLLSRRIQYFSSSQNPSPNLRSNTFIVNETMFCSAFQVTCTCSESEGSYSWEQSYSPHGFSNSHPTHMAGILNPTVEAQKNLKTTNSQQSLGFLSTHQLYLCRWGQLVY